MTDIEQHFMKLTRNLDAKASVREDAAEQLGLLFQHLILAQTTIDPPLHNFIVEKLLARSLGETSLTMQESMFSALIDALSYRLAEHLDWDILAQALPHLDQRIIEYALQALAFSHHLEYNDLIKHYCDHPDEMIRQTARESLVELQGRKEKRELFP